MTRPDNNTEALTAWGRFPLLPLASYGLCGSLSRAVAARNRRRNAARR